MSPHRVPTDAQGDLPVRIARVETDRTSDPRGCKGVFAAGIDESEDLLFHGDRTGEADLDLRPEHDST